MGRLVGRATYSQETEARAQIRLSLQARQSALSTLVSRLLVANNEREDETAAEVQGIYDQVQRQGGWLLAATLIVIAGTGLYVIRSNRRFSPNSRPWPTAIANSRSS